MEEGRKKREEKKAREGKRERREGEEERDRKCTSSKSLELKPAMCRRAEVKG